MVRFTRDDVVDTEAYADALNRLGYVFYDKEAAANTLVYLQCRADTLANRAVFVMKLRSGCRYVFLDKDAIYYYLTKCEGCPEHYFKTRKTQSISLDKNKVLSKLLKNGRATEFLTEYMAHRSMKSKYSSLRTLVKAGESVKSEVTDCYGAKLTKVPFTATETTNRRFNYREFDIISQIPKESASIIAAEDGYFLAWGDFAQSDFRIAYNLFMRSEENDKIMDAYDDKYEALARIVCKSLGKEFDLDEFKEQRQLYKQLTLATVYGTRGSTVPAENDFITMFSQFLAKCPRYMEYYNRLCSHTMMHSPILIRSYFGCEQFVYSEGVDRNTMLYEALNKPIQTGTSEVVILTTLSILKKARECGLTEDQFGLYMTRHDEPVFRIREDAIPYLWILKDHSTVMIDDWSKLALDFDFGYHYKKPDDGLRQKAAAVFAGHEEECIGEVSCVNSQEYYPVKPLFVTGFHAIPLPDAGVTIVAILEETTGKAIFSIFESTNLEDVVNNIRLKYKAAEPQICQEYTGVFVRNNFYDGEDYFGSTHVVYQREFSSSMNKVVMLCSGMVSLYCKKNGYEPPKGCEAPLTSYPPELSIMITE